MCLVISIFVWNRRLSSDNCGCFDSALISSCQELSNTVSEMTPEIIEILYKDYKA